MLAIALTLVCQPAFAEYRVGPGEVIEISVLGIPELQRKVTVDPDGSISFPVMGTIAVGGLTLAELRARVKTLLGGRGVALKGGVDGQGALALEVDDILVNVASYRPIYVKGDVVRAGEYPYRGPMAIREAVALAGGYPMLRTTGDELVLRSLDFKGELETLWLDLAKERAHVWRLNAEIGDSVEDQQAIIDGMPPGAPISKAALTVIVQDAAKQLEARKEASKHEYAAIDEIIKQLTDEIAATGEQVKAEEQAYQADLEELNHLGDLKEKGVVTSARFSDSRRAVVFSSTRVLQTNARLAEIKRQKTERELQKYKLGADRKVALYQELELAVARLGEVRTKLRSVGEKLQFTTGVKSSVGGADKQGPTFVVHRRTGKGIDHLVETEDFELMPGDVVDVVLRLREVVQSELTPKVAASKQSD